MCKRRCLWTDLPSNFYISSQTPGKNGISYANTEISIVNPSYLALEISEDFVMRIHPAVLQNCSAAPQSHSQTSIDCKAKMLNGRILDVSDQGGEGLVICKISGLSADSRSLFCFSSQTPGNRVFPAQVRRSHSSRINTGLSKAESTSVFNSPLNMFGGQATRTPSSSFDLLLLLLRLFRLRLRLRLDRDLSRVRHITMRQWAGLVNPVLRSTPKLNFNS
jgi:hypothetical protein